MQEVKNFTNNHINITYNFEGVSLTLLKEKAIWIQELGTLLIADLHFGKAAHFRKSGIPIPEPIHEADLVHLKKLQDQHRPNHTYFLGDLFHSDWNSQWEYFQQFLEQFPETEFHLVKGNHDILSPSAYKQSVLKIHNEPLILGNLILSHEPLENIPAGFLNICGHIHPGVRLIGKARQSVRIPCFFLSKYRLILPAFGNFTGLALVKPKADDKLWGITQEKIIPVLSGTSIG
jgi:DNA ligase-associated metallophosphoesterase